MARLRKNTKELWEVKKTYEVYLNRRGREYYVLVESTCNAADKWERNLTVTDIRSADFIVVENERTAVSIENYVINNFDKLTESREGLITSLLTK